METERSLAYMRQGAIGLSFECGCSMFKYSTNKDRQTYHPTNQHHYQPVQLLLRSVSRVPSKIESQRPFLNKFP